jgi:hypothetical protein
MTQSAKLKQLFQILSALEEFPARGNSLFSLSKLAQYLSLTKQDLEEFLAIVFRFQALFESTFEGKVLVRKLKSENEYLILKPKSEVKELGFLGPKEIEIDQDQAKILNDLVYYFLHIKIGKGFDVKQNHSELSTKVKRFKTSHPFFFERRGNGLVYPTTLAVEVGNLIRSHNKSKKSLPKIEIGEYLIKFA